MNRYIATFFIFFLTGLTSIAQTSSSLKDTGIVVLVTDSMTGLPLQKANITLATGQKITIINAGSTDSTGYFAFKSVPAGYYTVTISFAGYLSKTRHFIIRDSLPANQVFIAFTLPPLVKSLENVTITGSRNLIENKADRLVYNVEKDISSQAGVATDVLRKIPQVTVDINGNVELLGNPSVRFLINGKPSTVFGNSISDALQSIPATQIQSIEVMSSPGARYDASGTGGIINIILKKNKVKGFSGIANITAGSRLENGALNINYKKNNVGLSAYFSGSSQLKSLTISSSERSSVDTASQQQYHLQQAGSSDFDRFGYRSGASLDWDVNTKNNLTVSIAYYNFGNTNAGTATQQNTQTDKTGLLVFSEDSRRIANTQFNNATFESAIDLRKKFKKEHQELSFSYNYSAGSNNSAYFQSRAYLNTNTVFGGSSSKNPGKDYLSTFTLDYTTPVTKNIQFEIGLKTEIESLISNSSVYTFQPAQNQYYYDSRQSYDSRFRRQVLSAYATSSFSIFKTVNVIAGLRMEHTTNNAVYSKNPGIQIPDYSNLGPSLTISHTFKNQQSLKLSYA